jgi:hypothetical protein
MSYDLINLSSTRVHQIIEDVLDEYPVHPYQSAFSLPGFRQKLLAHIFGQDLLRRAVDALEESFNSSQARQYSRLKAQLEMEMVIRGSILHILRENSAWVSHHLPHV